MNIADLPSFPEWRVTSMPTVRCYFEGKPDTPDPADIGFARVPHIGETVVHADKLWRVVMVTWAAEGPYLDLSYVA